MTTVQTYLSGLPEKTKALFVPIFHDIDTFYQAVYLIARNEHVIEQEKPEKADEKLGMIRSIRSKIEKIVSGFGLSGKDLVADIASDYFEDYVNYRVKDPEIEDDIFIGIVQKVHKS